VTLGQGWVPGRACVIRVLRLIRQLAIADMIAGGLVIVFIPIILLAT
jgi:hypothetical protein